MKVRLDIYCVEKGLFETRQKAQAAIMAGLVIVNGRKADKAGQMVKEGDVIEIEGKNCPYVSRGGLKLKAALDHFSINLKNLICIDIGVATGGFSDCMLQEGAALVYGVDVGQGQIHEKVLADKRFIFLNNTNARFLTPDRFEKKPQFAAVDVSFISLKIILEPLIEILDSPSLIVLLVKPQFELSREFLRKGIVKDEYSRLAALAEIEKFILSNFKSCTIEGYIDCPVKGAAGNREFLMLVSKK